MQSLSALVHKVRGIYLDFVTLKWNAIVAQISNLAIATRYLIASRSSQRGGQNQDRILGYYRRELIFTFYVSRFTCLQAQAGVSHIIQYEIGVTSSPSCQSRSVCLGLNILPSN